MAGYELIGLYPTPHLSYPSHFDSNRTSPPRSIDISETLKKLFPSGIKDAEMKMNLSTGGIYYPKETSPYKFVGVKCYDSQLWFEPQNKNALFYRIKFSTDRGKKCISIHSEFFEEMREFLAQNGITVKKEFGSDCQYRENSSEMSHLATYHTNNPEVCSKLLAILIKMNQFECPYQDETIVTKFIEANSSQVEVSGTTSTSVNLMDRPDTTTDTATPLESKKKSSAPKRYHPYLAPTSSTSSSTLLSDSSGQSSSLTQTDPTGVADSQTTPLLKNLKPKKSSISFSLFGVKK